MNRQKTLKQPVCNQAFNRGIINQANEFNSQMMAAVNANIVWECMVEHVFDGRLYRGEELFSRDTWYSLIHGAHFLTAKAPGGTGHAIRLASQKTGWWASFVAVWGLFPIACDSIEVACALRRHCYPHTGDSCCLNSIVSLHHSNWLAQLIASKAFIAFRVRYKLFSGPGQPSLYHIG